MFAVRCALVLCVALTASNAFELGDLDVIFHLYTQQNPTISQPLLSSFNSILTSGFNPDIRTIFTIHDFGEGVGGNFNAFLVPAHLSVENVNVLAVDWSAGSSMYTQGLGNARQCGEVIATFINILINQFNYNVNNIRIVGVGLGGHIAGIAARNVVRPLPHIIALDPSFLGWTHNPDILNAEDADVVEVLHTSAGILGYDYPLGDLDFYANGGSVQTGCPNPECSHIYSYVFYAESITQAVNGGNRFVGTKCEAYENATTLACSGDRDVIFGGSQAKTNESGIYVFLTNLRSPFARG